MSDNLGPAPGATNSTSVPDSSAHDPATQTELDAAKGLPLAPTGAVLATRYVGRWAATGAPATGTFAVGDFGFDGANTTQICSVAGSPGTWVAAGGGSGTSSLFGDWIYGDGSDGSITLADGDVLHAGNYVNVTIPEGVTVTVDPAPRVSTSAPPLICCTGTYTINGTIDLRGTDRTNRLDIDGFDGASNDPFAFTPAAPIPALFPGGGGGSGASGAGSAAGIVDGRVRHPLAAYTRGYPGASGAAGGGNGDGTNFGGAPGDPGNWFLLFAKTIVHGPNNLYLLDGGDGGAGGDDGTGVTGHGNCGGGGGGGGGWWMTICNTIVGSANESGAGGAGGAGCGTGTNGTAGTTGHGIHLFNHVD